jgi:phosphatidylserine synthase
MTVEAPALVRPIGARYDRQFYTGMAIAAAVVVFVGFAPTYFLRDRYQTTPLPTYLHAHGFLFTMWIALFVAQTLLVAVRRTNVHRRLGWAVATLAVVMVVVGTSAGIWSMRRQVDDGFVQEAQAFLTTSSHGALCIGRTSGAVSS